MLRLLLLLVLAAFGAYSTYAMLQVGYLGIWQAGMANPGALQVLLDLCVMASLVSLWMYTDARRASRNPWPYLLLTMVGGSFGPLLYLAVGSFRRGAPTLARA